MYWQFVAVAGGLFFGGLLSFSQRKDGILGSVFAAASSGLPPQPQPGCLSWSDSHLEAPVPLGFFQPPCIAHSGKVSSPHVPGRERCLEGKGWPMFFVFNYKKKYD